MAIATADASPERSLIAEVYLPLTRCAALLGVTDDRFPGIVMDFNIRYQKKVGGRREYALLDVLRVRQLLDRRRKEERGSPEARR